MSVTHVEGFIMKNPNTSKSNKSGSVKPVADTAAPEKIVDLIELKADVNLLAKLYAVASAKDPRQLFVKGTEWGYSKVWHKDTSGKWITARDSKTGETIYNTTSDKQIIWEQTDGTLFITKFGSPKVTTTTESLASDIPGVAPITKEHTKVFDPIKVFLIDRLRKQLNMDEGATGIMILSHLLTSGDYIEFIRSESVGISKKTGKPVVYTNYLPVVPAKYTGENLELDAALPTGRMIDEVDLSSEYNELV